MVARARASNAASTPYFAAPKPRVLAHRGLALGVPENTLAAFERAVAAGADYVETDVNASADGVAVVLHDPTLDRIVGRADRVSDLTLDQLQAIDLGDGVRFVTLRDALEALPGTRFNIDIKSADVAGPAAAAIQAAGAVDRVLITSFSGARRRAATALLGERVATSASASEFVPALLLAKLGLTPLVRFALRRVDAVQIPMRIFGIATTTRRTVARLQAAGVEVHVWTINDVSVAKGLLERGVDGIVTDRADLMLALTSPEGGIAGIR